MILWVVESPWECTILMRYKTGYNYFDKLIKINEPPSLHFYYRTEVSNGSTRYTAIEEQASQAIEDRARLARYATTAMFGHAVAVL